MRHLAWLLALAVLLGGCLEDDTDQDDTPDPDMPTGEDDEPTGPVVKTGTGTVDRSVGTPAVSINQGAGGEFSVAEGATLLHAEIRWDDTSFDIDLALDGPDGPDDAGQDFYEHTAEGGSPGAGDSPHSITLSPADEPDWVGGWTLTAFANGAAADLPYEWAVTVFYGETSVPEGYTGFDAA